MPSEIASHNALAALALIMHEAAHIAHSDKIPEKFMKDPIKKDIINAIEDARIDIKNFNKMYNIRGFYERMYRDHKKPDPSKVPLPVKLLINQILGYEQMARYKFKDKETREWESKNKKDPDYDKHLEYIFQNGVHNIECEDWKELDRTCDKIIKLLKITKPFSEQMPQDLVIEGAMQGDGKGSKGEGQGVGVKVKDGGDKDGQAHGQKGDEDSEDGDLIGTGHDPTYYDGINIIDAILHPKSILSKGQMDGARGDQIGPAALQEQTRQKFKELLNMKTKVHKTDGTMLDVDNLISLHTGDVETLFKEEIIKHEKKSKIMILMDCSGSMQSPLLDNKWRSDALVSCVKSVVDILDEVIELEGINVEYDMAAFHCEYVKLDKGNWVKQYNALSGGTNFHNAFHQAITDLANDNSIDGKKMIVCFTDGDVGDDQILDVKNDIIAYGSDVRAMIVGIGTDPCSKMSQDVVGDNIILASESADLVLMETIGEML
jgi:hypothetical protein